MIEENPWLAIPASDYEGHMEEVAQRQPLREIFQRVYHEVRPRRLAVLGCGPGHGLEAVELERTERLLAVDLNPEYLELAKQRHARLGAVAEWLCAPVEQCDFAAGSFDLVHAALLFEYLDPAPVLASIARWLAPGGAFSVVLQLPAEEDPISETGFSSLQQLSSLMRLVRPDRFQTAASRAGLRLRSSRHVPLARGKEFCVGLFSR